MRSSAAPTSWASARGFRASVPNEPSVRRLVGAILLEQNDEWQLQHRYLTLETMAGVAALDDSASPALLKPIAA
jgi:putative transposase